MRSGHDLTRIEPRASRMLVLTYDVMHGTRGSDRVYVSASEHHVVAKGAKGGVAPKKILILYSIIRN